MADPGMRVDPYSVAHKGQRHRLASFIVQAGQLDADETRQRVELSRGLLQFLDHLEVHAAHEKKHLHPLLQSCDPDLVYRLEVEHDGLDEATKWLRKNCDAIVDRPSAGNDTLLYRSLVRFSSSYFAHIDGEEQGLPLVWAKHPDDKLRQALQGMLYDSLPGERRYFLSITLPAISITEQQRLIATWKKNLPDEEFAKLSSIIDPLVAKTARAPAEPEPHDWPTLPPE